MTYLPRTQKFANLLPLDTRGREDKYSVYQQILNTIGFDTNNIFRQIIQNRDNGYLATYDYNTLSLLGYVLLPKDFSLNDLPPTTISVTSPYRSYTLTKANRLSDLKYGQKVEGSIINSDTLSISGNLLNGISISNKETPLVDSGKYLIASNHFVYFTLNIGNSDSILFDNPIKLILEGLDQFNSPISENIIITKNETVKSLFKYFKLIKLTIENYSQKLEQLLLTNPIQLNLIGQVSDSNFKVYPNNYLSDNDGRKIVWSINGNNLIASYPLAFTESDYFAGVNELENYNTYELRDSSNTPITPIAFTIDNQKQLIYVLDSNNYLNIYDKFEEYPPSSLLKKIESEKTYLTQIVINIKYLSNGNIQFIPKYTRHRRGKRVSSFKFYYENETSKWSYNGSSFDLTEPYYIDFDNQGEYGFFDNPVEVTLDPGFYVITFETLFDDGSIDKFKRIVDKGFKKALFSYNVGISTNYDLLIDEYGDVEIIQVAGYSDNNQRLRKTFKTTYPYFLYDSENKIIYFDSDITSVSWTGQSGNVFSYSGTDIQKQNVFSEIDDIGLLLGIERNKGESDREFVKKLYLMGNYRPNVTFDGANNLGKHIFNNLNESSLVNEIKSPLYTISSFINGPFRIYINNTFLCIENLAGDILYKIDLLRVRISDIKTALDVFCSISIYQELVGTDVSAFTNSSAINLLPFDNKISKINEIIEPTTFYYINDANVISDSILLSDLSIKRVNSLSNLNNTEDKAYFFDINDNGIYFNFTTSRLLLSYSFLSDSFNILYSPFRPLALSEAKESLVQFDFKNTNQSVEIINNITSLEKNRWG